MVQMIHLDTLVDLRPPQDDRWSFHARKFPRITRSVSDRPPIRKLDLEVSILTEQSGKSVLHPPDNSAFVALKFAQDRKIILQKTGKKVKKRKQLVHRWHHGQRAPKAPAKRCRSHESIVFGIFVPGGGRIWVSTRKRDHGESWERLNCSGR